MDYNKNSKGYLEEIYLLVVRFRTNQKINQLLKKSINTVNIKNSQIN